MKRSSTSLNLTRMPVNHSVWGRGLTSSLRGWFEVSKIPNDFLRFLTFNSCNVHHMYIQFAVKFEWDPAKATRNLLKHGVGFAEAVIALEDENALIMEDMKAVGEARYVSIGLDSTGRALVVVFVYRDDSIRVISARKASRSEVKTYGKRIRLQ